MDFLLIIGYALLGYNANQYLRRNLLGQVGVIYSDTGHYFLSQFIWGMLLGFITIPLAIIVFIFKSVLSGSR